MFMPHPHPHQAVSAEQCGVAPPYPQLQQEHDTAAWQHSLTQKHNLTGTRAFIIFVVYCLLYKIIKYVIDNKKKL